MGLLDLFSSNTPDFGSNAPSIGGVSADLTNINDLVNGRAKADDYGAGIGGGVGAFFGAPQEGADIGRTVFPILNQTVRPFFSNLWNSISK